MMRILEIAMRLVCFVIGIMLAFGMTVRIHDGDTREVLANMIFVLDGEKDADKEKKKGNV